MAYITKQIAGEYTSSAAYVRAYLQKLRDFLLDNPIKKFQLVEEDYSNENSESWYIKMKADGLTFRLSNITNGRTTQQVTISYDTENQENVTLQTYSTVANNSVFVTNESPQSKYRAVSNVFLASNNNSFIFSVQPIDVKKLAPKILWGVINYQDLNAKSNSFAFATSNNANSGDSLILSSMDKTTGTAIKCNICHKATNDDTKLVLENKVQVNQNDYWIGTSNDIVGLVPVTPIKAYQATYQANSKKYIAIGTNVAFPIGQQIEV